MNQLPDNNVKVENDVTSNPEVVNFEKFVSEENCKIFLCIIYTSVNQNSSITELNQILPRRVKIALIATIIIGDGV